MIGKKNVFKGVHPISLKKPFPPQKIQKNIFWELITTAIITIIIYRPYSLCDVNKRYIYGIMHDKLAKMSAPLFNEDVLILGNLNILHIFRSSVLYNVYSRRINRFWPFL